MMAIRRVFQSAPCTALEASLPGAAKAAAEAAAPARAPSGLILEVNDVVHSYGPVMALDHVSLSAKRGEFLTILGESGSGKTTMLRVISGLEVPSSVARLAIDGVDVTGVPAAQRNCTTVFQSYALFPHMSVEENVAYGLKLRKVGHEERRERTRPSIRSTLSSSSARACCSNSPVISSVRASGAGGLMSRNLQVVRGATATRGSNVS